MAQDLNQRMVSTPSLEQEIRASAQRSAKIRQELAQLSLLMTQMPEAKSDAQTQLKALRNMQSALSLLTGGAAEHKSVSRSGGRRLSQPHLI